MTTVWLVPSWFPTVVVVVGFLVVVLLTAVVVFATPGNDGAVAAGVFVACLFGFFALCIWADTAWRQFDVTAERRVPVIMAIKPFAEPKDGRPYTEPEPKVKP